VVALGADGSVEEERVGQFVRGGDAVAVVDVPEDVERGPDGLEPPQKLGAADVAGRAAPPSRSEVAVAVGRAVGDDDVGAFRDGRPGLAHGRPPLAHEVPVHEGARVSDRPVAVAGSVAAHEVCEAGDVLHRELVGAEAEDAPAGQARLEVLYE